MKTIILAGGYATRLYPLTLDKPKSLLRVGNKLMIEHTIAMIEHVPGIEELFIVTNEKFYRDFLSWSRRYKGTIPVHILNDRTTSNEDRLGAVGDIQFVIDAEHIRDDLLVIGSDNLTEASLKKMAAYFGEKDGSVIGVRNVRNLSLVARKLGVVIVNKENQITDFEEKPENPKSTLAATLIYFLKREHVPLIKKCIEEHGKPDNAGDFIRWLSKRKRVYAYVIAERWFDIGNLKQYEEADAYMKQKGEMRC